MSASYIIALKIVHVFFGRLIYDEGYLLIDDIGMFVGSLLAPLPIWFVSLLPLEFILPFWLPPTLFRPMTIFAAIITFIAGKLSTFRSPVPRTLAMVAIWFYICFVVCNSSLQGFTSATV